MEGKPLSETLNLWSLPNSPNDFAPNHGPSSAKNHLIPFDLSLELPQQLETASGFCLDILAERFTHRSCLKDVVNEAEGIFERMELLDQAYKFRG